ncbi:hypothetical protein OTK49_20670 [Vibrio coralliirubri]|uniref:hypothetical protein n=1 Tax=Vibrio coralliirubri TaxID=1516159 RepID=UPI002283E76F|nr:hypothetical protein [Vibrio coralliirubri]MCY9864932.1 hypothetical protein [Vibrio coralliirubri]
MNTTISSKAELKAHIAGKKLSVQATELAKSLVNESNSADSRIVSHMIAKAIDSQETFGTIIKGAAKIYSEANPFADARMQAGKTMLQAIAMTDVTEMPSNAYTLSLPEVPKYVDINSGEKVFELCNSFINFAGHSDTNMVLAQSALSDALRTTHPTISQLFLGSTRTAMISIEDSVFYSALSNAYQGAFPYI